MTAATITSSEFEDGDLDYIANLNKVRDDIQSLLTEISEGRLSFDDLPLRLANLQAQISTISTNAISASVGLTAILQANNFKITELGNATDPADAVNLATAQALLAGGAVPGDIPVTDLGVGTLISGQSLVRDGATLTGLKGLLKTVAVSATGNCVANTLEQVSLSSNITRTLPPSPLIDDEVGFSDVLSNFGTFVLSIDPGGSKKIENTALGEIMTVTNPHAYFRLKYIGSNVWKVIML